MGKTEAAKRARGRIEIDEAQCKGCRYCVEFCPKSCIVIEGDKFTSQGYMLPVFKNPDACTGCGICSWMCPSMAIEVYKSA